MVQEGPIVGRNFLRIKMRNFEETFYYEVSEDENNQLKDILYNTSFDELDYRNKQFITFKTVDDLTIIVAIDKIQYVHFLWERPEVIIRKESNEDRFMHMKLYLVGKEQPMDISFEEPEDMEPLFEGLSADIAPLTFAFVCFDDENGETIALNLEDIVLMDIAINWEEELPEED